MKFKHAGLSAALLTLALFLTACSGSKDNSLKLQGAGASFPAPLYLKWFKSYSERTQTSKSTTSRSVGKRVKLSDKTVDFAASDAAMKPDDMAKVDGGVQLIPMTAGAIVLHNLPDVPNLRLSRNAYVSVFGGKVTNGTIR